MIKLTITEIGTPRTVETKFGQKEKSYIKSKEHGDKFLNYWLGESTKSWKVGDVIEVESVDPRDYTAKDGSLKTSYDIKLPRTGFGEIIKRIEALEGEITKLKLTKADMPQNYSKVTGTNTPYPKGEPEEPNFDLFDPPF